jgi:superfamily II DNA/RNA helicase
MKNKSTDTTFFTNEEGSTLLDRFKQTLKYVENFDILVGYFRTSGFYSLYKELEKVKKIRILNGIDVDKKTFTAYQESQSSFDFENSLKLRQRLSEEFKDEILNNEDNQETYEGYHKFIEFLNNGKIEFRQHPSHKLHAKVYISRFGKPVSDVDYGRVITGSSNFSISGLESNYEFNVELKDENDVNFALKQFNNLWNEGEDLKNIFIDTLQNKTWLNDKITPYELYLKTLFEYFYEDINIDKETDFNFPEEYMDLEYQKQAVVSANKILEAHNGVFLADVVGLGKTYIAALLAQQPNLKPARKLFIVPPVLVDYWRETLSEFGVIKYRVESAGQIKNIKNWDKLNEVEYVFLDEAHRFRNEDTETWKELYENICFGKKIILITATAINNKFSDLLSQIKLFQKPNRSNIPAVRNLQNFFKSWENKVKKAKNDGGDEYMDVVRRGSKEIREKVLKHVMVRRTRKEVKEFFNNDLKSQNLEFPSISTPLVVRYEFDEKTNQAFNETIDLIKNKFLKARYKPYYYLKEKPTEFELTRQENLGGFMKTMIIKRLESSFHAFKKTIDRFVVSHENYIKMINKGNIYISKKINIFDLLDEDDDEKINDLINDEKIQQFKKEDFNENFIEDVQNDLNTLISIQNIWKDLEEDPKINKLISILKNDSKLKNKKIIIFTESAETGLYLLKELSKEFSKKVLFYSSKGGRLIEDNKIKNLSQRDGRRFIRENFDPNIKNNKKDNLRILVTTDVLAEGINLHRSNININYDLPWNPTKVIQRIGRINRVGTEFKNINVYNFFPTEKSDNEIHQKKNIISKIQAFHDCLGSDAKILTESEQVQTFNLFGSNLYDNLNKKEFYDDNEDTSQSELKYLKVIRDIRDTNKDLYEKIKNIPKKSRSAKKNLIKSEDSLLSFFRVGKLKKFIYTDKKNSPTELTFIEAIKILESKIDCKKEKLNKIFFDLLNKNKDYFNEIIFNTELENTKRAGQSLERYLIEILKTLKKEKTFKDEDHIIRDKILRAFEDGIIARMRAKEIKKELDNLGNNNDCFKILKIFKKNISEKFIDSSIREKSMFSGRREIILSEYLIK